MIATSGLPGPMERRTCSSCGCEMPIALVQRGKTAVLQPGETWRCRNEVACRKRKRTRETRPGKRTSKQAS
jgi:hypothetical protein